MKNNPFYIWLIKALYSKYRDLITDVELVILTSIFYIDGEIMWFTDFFIFTFIHYLKDFNKSENVISAYK